MKWSVEYSTGVDEIDHQHKMLFTMSEDFRTSLDEGEGKRTYGLMLESLDQYARGHFGIEETCMAHYQCPVAEVNRRAHGKFVDALREFHARYQIRGFSRSDAYSLVDFVDEWLANHIARIDVKLKDCAKP